MTGPTPLPIEHTPPRKRVHGLRAKLLRSHLLVAAIGLSGSCAALVVTISLRTGLVRLMEVREPTVHESKRVLTGLQRSLAALRGWILLGEPEYRSERTRAWRAEIEPALTNLALLGDAWQRDDDRARLRRIRRLLRELEEAQWWIEDVARTPGNEPARALLTNGVDDAFEVVANAITAMIEEETRLRSGNRAELLGAMADIRYSVTRSRVVLGAFTVSGLDAQEAEFQRMLDVAREAASLLDRHRDSLTAEQGELLSLLRDELRAYASMVARIGVIRRSEHHNVALHRLATEAVPRAREVTDLLTAMVSRQQELARADALLVTTTTNASIVCSLFLMFGIAWAAWRISSRRARQLSEPIAGLSRATRELAAGRLHDDIPGGDRDDELGALTESFNTMRRSLQATEDALQGALEDARAASRAKGEFLANTSHEIRTPMNAIIGLTKLVLEGELDDLHRAYLDTVASSGEALLQLINDVLDFSKIEAGKLELEQREFGLRDTVGDLLKSLAPQAHAKGLELTCRVAPDVPDSLVGDPGRLRQILTNLVGNAVKFTAEGHVALEIRCPDGPRGDERPTDAQSGDAPVELLFAVRDTGIGIERDQLDRVFGAFEQADASSTRRYGGTGLGLSITSDLVGRMGGRVQVESEFGRGTTMRFTARFGRGEGAGRQPWRKVVSGLRDARILIVDDCAENLLVLEELTTSYGMRPTTVWNGPDAMCLLARAARAGAPFDLVLADAGVPLVEDPPPTEANRRETEARDVPLVLLICSTDGPTAQPVRGLEVSSQLTKPVKPSELFEAVLHALGLDREMEAASDHSPCTAGQTGVIALETGVAYRRLRILLVDDSPPNRMLAQALLNGAGHEVEVAVNGREAVEATAEHDFDLVLMDGQMPEMDGFAATCAIREREKGTGRHVPIVAMTAHALDGDRERCLDIGMDGYVSKPIDKAVLLSEIEAAVRSARPPIPAPKPVPGARDESTRERQERSASSEPRDAASAGRDPVAIPWDELLTVVGGDRSILEEIVEAYAGEMSGVVLRLQAAIEGGDARLLRMSAHKLKSALGFLRLEEAAESAARLERMGEREDLRDAAAEFRDLQSIVAEVETLLARFRAAPANLG